MLFKDKRQYQYYLRGFSIFKRAFSLWIRLLNNDDKNSYNPEMFRILFWGYLSGLQKI
jgi:hypothetical protein